MRRSVVRGVAVHQQIGRYNSQVEICVKFTCVHVMTAMRSWCVQNFLMNFVMIQSVANPDGIT